MSSLILNSLWLIAVDPHRGGSISLRPLFRLPWNLPRHVLPCLISAPIHDLAVQLQIAHIGALLALDMVEDFGAREIAVKREVARDRTLHGILDQLDT